MTHQVCSSDSQQGFTLIELVTVVVILGIIGMAIGPRLVARIDYDQRGLADQTLAALRYAQKSAIAQHRQVCVQFNPGGAVRLNLTIQSAPNVAGCDANLLGPADSAPYQIVTNNATYAAAVNFSYNAQGVPTVGQVIRVTGANRTITVDAGTGHAY